MEAGPPEGAERDPHAGGVQHVAAAAADARHVSRVAEKPAGGNIVVDGADVADNLDNVGLAARQQHRVGFEARCVQHVVERGIAAIRALGTQPIVPARRTGYDAAGACVRQRVPLHMAKNEHRVGCVQKYRRGAMRSINRTFKIKKREICLIGAGSQAR